MKLLLDQNLSPKIVKLLGSEFECFHLQDFNLDIADDTTVWNFAQQNNFTIVTKDSDFSDILLLKNFPPKIIWIRKGNCTTMQIANLLIQNKDSLHNFNNQSEMGILLIK